MLVPAAPERGPVRVDAARPLLEGRFPPGQGGGGDHEYPLRAAVAFAGAGAGEVRLGYGGRTGRVRFEAWYRPVDGRDAPPDAALAEAGGSAPPRSREPLSGVATDA